MDNIYDISIEGIGNVGGGCYKDIKVEGIGTILGDVKGEKISVEGVAKAEGFIKCNDLNVEGKLRCKGTVEVSDRARITGYMSISGDLQCREVFSDGKLCVSNLLSADKVFLSLCSKNKIKEIGGEEITVISERKSIFQGILYSNKLESYSIEGDRIVLENTECTIVRGHNVTINRGCNIESVEYTGEIFVDDRSQVKNIVKL